MVRLTDCPDMTLDVYRGRKTTVQQQQQQKIHISPNKCPSCTKQPLLLSQKYCYITGNLHEFLFTFCDWVAF